MKIFLSALCGGQLPASFLLHHCEVVSDPCFECERRSSAVSICWRWGRTVEGCLAGWIYQQFELIADISGECLICVLYAYVSGCTNISWARWGQAALLCNLAFSIL